MSLLSLNCHIALPLTSSICEGMAIVIGQLGTNAQL